jgi:aspartyl-tRNA(Asn)/glutamyl-tRNA(Gln) amidotransferase subunit A
MTTTLTNNSATSQDSGPLHYQDATTLAALIATKQVSSREVVQAQLDRSAEVNPKINAIVTLLAEDALRDADATDKAVARGAELGPCTEFRSASTTHSTSPASPPNAAPNCSPGSSPTPTRRRVARFKAAGGIPIAKTNQPSRVPPRR